MKKLLFIVVFFPLLASGQQLHHYIKNGLYWDNVYRPFNGYSLPELNDLDSMANNAGIPVSSHTSDSILNNINALLTDIDGGIQDIDNSTSIIRYNTDTIKTLIRKYDVLLDIVEIAQGATFVFSANTIILAAFNTNTITALNTAQIIATTGLTDIDRMYLIGNMAKAPGTYPQQFNNSNALSSRTVTNGNLFKISIAFAKIN